MKLANAVKKLTTCAACALHRCQGPLLDKMGRADVMWVGLSAKLISENDEDIPLGPDTVTGAVINRIERPLRSIQFYKTNLVKCPPLDDQSRLRYPNTVEMEACIRNLEHEIQIVKPTVVFLLGLQVAKFFFSRVFHRDPVLPSDYNYLAEWGAHRAFVPVHHPSYIAVYRRGDEPNYRDGVRRLIRSLLN